MIYQYNYTNHCRKHGRLKDFKDIEIHKSIRNIDLSNNDLEKIDLSNTKFEKIYINNNKLKEIKLPNTVQSLYINNNQIRQLDLPIGLKKLSCVNNALSYIPKIPETVDFLLFGDDQIQCWAKSNIANFLDLLRIKEHVKITDIDIDKILTSRPCGGWTTSYW